MVQYTAIKGCVWNLAWLPTLAAIYQQYIFCHKERGRGGFLESFMFDNPSGKTSSLCLSSLSDPPEPGVAGLTRPGSHPAPHSCVIGFVGSLILHHNIYICEGMASELRAGLQDSLESGRISRAGRSLPVLPSTREACIPRGRSRFPAHTLPGTAGFPP